MEKFSRYSLATPIVHYELRMIHINLVREIGLKYF